jgi:hypothetical protein
MGGLIDERKEPTSGWSVSGYEILVLGGKAGFPFGVCTLRLEI